MKRRLLQEALKNIVTQNRAPTESIDVIFGRAQKMPLAGVECDECGVCSKVCPSNAIDTSGEWTIDLGKCLFCWDCRRACTKEAISPVDAPDYAVSREGLIFTKNTPPVKNKDTLDAKKLKAVGRSVFIREVDTGSCNGCEVEVNALSNQFYDSERFGIKIVASPRHADVLLITGPLTKNMYDALMKAAAATPEPKVIIAMGTCAISGGLFSKGEVVGEGIGGTVDVDMYVPGCPPAPDRLIRAMLTAFGLTEQK
ncbi:HyfI, H-like protein [Candidatus Methanoplasma termitum]|uniref:MbhJ protein n=1 Tax=Candidatus Methanoplasma termitum TaxID=1577791 RepID=A0A0A7LEK8_9ARCH|nr:4Fe-4S binding protein [Candidatus Methanoplasma termitum]AIZ56752.1 HyfI, H-like protein [Candidatus Methanoplasma termitum]